MKCKLSRTIATIAALPIGVGVTYAADCNGKGFGDATVTKLTTSLRRLP